MYNNTKLRIAIKAINDPVESNGPVPSLLLFGTMKTFPTPANTNQTQAGRFRAIALERSKMETITAENRIK